MMTRPSGETIHVHPNTEAAHARQLAVALEHAEMIKEVSVHSTCRAADKYDIVPLPSVTIKGGRNGPGPA